ATHVDQTPLLLGDDATQVDQTPLLPGDDATQVDHTLPLRDDATQVDQTSLLHPEAELKPWARREIRRGHVGRGLRDEHDPLAAVRLVHHLRAKPLVAGPGPHAPAGAEQQEGHEAQEPAGVVELPELLEGESDGTTALLRRHVADGEIVDPAAVSTHELREDDQPYPDADRFEAVHVLAQSIHEPHVRVRAAREPPHERARASLALETEHVARPEGLPPFRDAP